MKDAKNHNVRPDPDPQAGSIHFLKWRMADAIERDDAPTVRRLTAWLNKALIARGPLDQATIKAILKKGMNYG